MSPNYIQISRGDLNEAQLDQLLSCLLRGGVALVPTDSLYSLIGLSSKTSALEKICKIKNIRPEKELFSIFCRDISSVAELTAQIDRSIFKIIKKNTPGPFTFILKASHSLNKVLKNRKETVGVRIPKHPLWQQLSTLVDSPIIGSSAPGQEEITDEDEHLAWINHFHLQVDLIWDEGFQYSTPTAIINCLSSEIEVIREGPNPLIM